MRLVVACVLAASLAGCMAPDPQAPAGLSTSSASAQRPLVVALLDSGINPYHVAFAAPPGGATLPGTEAVPVTLGMDGEDWASRVEEDQAIWDALQPGTLYRFDGTRLMAISFGHRGGPVILDPTGHGTHTSSIVARDAPQALLVTVQVDSRICDEDPSCLADPSVAEGMEWAAEQPWIDVISVSMSIPGNAPDPTALHPDAARYAAASRRAWESGKLVVTAAGNDPSVTLADYFDGPAWIVCVGGALGSSHGEATLASRGVDVVANVTTLVADHRSFDGTLVDVGTSMAAPAVAATLAEAMRLGSSSLPPPGTERRDALRAALNATATTFSPTEWTPTAPEPSINGVFSLSNAMLVEGVQGGWGYVDASMAPRIAQAASGASDGAVDGPRALWQAQWHAARVAYWSAPPPGS